MYNNHNSVKNGKTRATNPGLRTRHLHKESYLNSKLRVAEGEMLKLSENPVILTY